MKSDCILYNFQNDSTFIKADREILSSEYKILNFKYSPKSKLSTIGTTFYQLFYILQNWNKYPIIISQIAGLHTFTPSLLSFLKFKKHLIILHGTDSNIIPEINYGNLQKPYLKWFTKFSIKHATLLVPVSLSLIESQSKYNTDKNARFGLRNIIQDFNTQFEVINNGLDGSLFKIINFNRSPETFLTVALDLHLEKNVKLKGVDLILQLAKAFPELSFTIIGSEKIYGYDDSLNNVKLIGKVSQEELIQHYNSHKFYFQLSMSESFGLSLCEAMLCGCIPIVSNVGMMHEIIEDEGYILEKRDFNELKEIFFQIVNNPKIISQQKLRNLIIDKYSKDIRKEKLLNLLNKLLSHQQ
jgi:glycosyltransferase involved in cell wall biosynthesis